MNKNKMTDLDELAMRVYRSSPNLKILYTEKQYIEAFKNGTLNDIKVSLSQLKSNKRRRGKKGINDKKWKSIKSKKSLEI